MANIQQAAQWVAEGHDVIRHTADGLWWLSPWYPLKGTFQVVGEQKELTCEDLLAEDWELAG